MNMARNEPQPAYRRLATLERHLVQLLAMAGSPLQDHYVYNYGSQSGHSRSEVNRALAVCRAARLVSQSSNRWKCVSDVCTVALREAASDAQLFDRLVAFCEKLSARSETA